MASEGCFCPGFCPVLASAPTVPATRPTLHDRSRPALVWAVWTPSGGGVQAGRSRFEVVEGRRNESATAWGA